MARRLGFVLLSALLCVTAAATQSPTRFLACESRDNTCAQPSSTLDQTWTFDGTEGTATSTSEEQPAHLSIQKFDSTALVIQRTDTSGRTAVYTGTVQGTHISGTVQWSWPGHAGYPASGVFSAMLQDSVAAVPAPAALTSATTSPLPPQLLVCENQGPPCSSAWIFHGTDGTAVWFDQNHTHAHLSIVRAEPDYIVIRRTDTTSPNSAVYTGSLRGDHYVGTIVYSSLGHPGDRTGSWSASVPKFTCDPHDDLSRQEAMTTGQTALMFHHGAEAMACYTVAARDGDVTAQRVVGLLYYQGNNDVPQNYTQALYWLQKAADQDVYQAERLVSQMYEAGLGTKPNPALAKMYRERADEQKHDFEREQQRADMKEEGAANRSAQVLSSFVLGASFGLFW
ncbi:tetratricopeptide repeat protein [Silvibacterium sp.]|uniref:tetratricopeptide repeat protein n=1 Tax=Silvibacterium sp. TaxID=1964179 RepID=UPI0039E4AAF1